jgi:hypothetical protein
VSLGGLLNRRVEFSMSARALIGDFGVQENASFFDTYQGSAGLSFALTRIMRLSAGYSYYSYRFDTTAGLPSDVPPTVGRQSLQATFGGGNG